ncbi:mug86 [Candida metapsilosis]|uniref:Mug86 n=1 Tax=Candida metapsilosis TaxID=273372 RepID=A0A8H8DD01_9ASCO|nr:mug86 [Candida metapsilosis]
MSSASSQHSAPSKHPSTDVDDAGVSKVHIHGDGNEFVTINGQKFYRHELMAAFGGTLNPGAAPYPKININPAPIGLCGFALTTFVLSLVNARAMGITIPNAVVSLACFYGGMVQFLAGLCEFAAGNTFGFTALTSYGAFWLSYAAIFIESFGIAAAYAESDQKSGAVAFFLLGWALFTFLLLLNTMKSTWAFFSLFFFLFLTFLLLAGGDFSGRVGVTRAGGVIGVITAIIAWYNAFAGTATKLNSYITAHPFPMPSNISFKKHK